MLSCDHVALCPENCQICTACLRLLGCTDAGASGNSSSFTVQTYVYVLAAASGVVALVVIYYSMNRDRQESTDLETHLMSPRRGSNSSNGGGSADGNSTGYHEFPDLLTTPRSSRRLDDTTGSRNPVWLAPEVPPAQFEPSTRAALESSGESCDLSSSANSDKPFLSEICQKPSSPGEEDSSVPAGKTKEGPVWLAPVT